MNNNKRIVEYTVAGGSWADEYELGVERVNILICEGWQPLLGGFSQDDNGWGQAMVKYEEES